MINAPRFGTGIGLRRVDALLTELGIDRHWLANCSINITGSNGKGSTAVFTGEIAKSHGLKTGVFTSPHLYSFTERFKIDGDEVAPQELEGALTRVEQAAAKVVFPGENFGGFELLFAAAVDLFSRHDCEVCIYEAGIGGRYDPVRLTRSKTSTVTSLDYEHTAVLGETLELICLDKTDICSAGGTVFYGINCGELAELIRTYGGLSDLKVRILGQDIALTVISENSEGTEFDLGGESESGGRYFVPLLGAHQANNAALALLLFEEWSVRCGRRCFSIEKARTGLLNAKWPGRLQSIGDNPLTIIDVGHSPDGISAALKGLKAAYPKTNFVLVTGVSIDKDAEQILSILAPEFSRFVCTRAYQRGREAEEIAAIVEGLNPSAVIECAATIEQAVRISQDAARSANAAIYVAGGMYISAEYATAAAGSDPQQLPHLF